jgi:hypothetical protein
MPQPILEVTLRGRDPGGEQQAQVWTHLLAVNQSESIIEEKTAAPQGDWSSQKFREEVRMVKEKLAAPPKKEQHAITIANDNPAVSAARKPIKIFGNVRNQAPALAPVQEDPALKSPHERRWSTLTNFAHKKEELRTSDKENTERGFLGLREPRKPDAVKVQIQIDEARQYHTAGNPQRGRAQSSAPKRMEPDLDPDQKDGYFLAYKDESRLRSVRNYADKR